MGRKTQIVTVSDWIQFLNSRISHVNTILIAIVSTLISLIALFFVIWAFQLNMASLLISLEQANVSVEILQQMNNVSKSLNDIKGTIFILIVTLGAIFASLSVSERFFSRPRLLLDEILKKKEAIDPDEIREKWFKKSRFEFEKDLIDIIKDWKKKKLRKR